MRTSAATEIRITEVVAKLEQPSINWRRFIVIPPSIWMVINVVGTVAWVSGLGWGGYRASCWLIG